MTAQISSILASAIVAQSAAPTARPGQLQFVIIGLGTVFLVLILLYAAIRLLAWIINREARAPQQVEPISGGIVSRIVSQPQPVADAPAAFEPEPTRPQLDPPQVAALAYAVYRRRLSQGRPPGVQGGPGSDGAWSRKARLDQSDRLSSRWENPR
ncbi:MAG: OadG family protein [Candidatus Alcyoniella australis]|nr:OadG family protein [Candidatus Alcyoniella australis]